MSKKGFNHHRGFVPDSIFAIPTNRPSVCRYPRVHCIFVDELTSKLVLPSFLALPDWILWR